jgi:pimeloyl-ACP methyl ester carboxylesterase
MRLRPLRRLPVAFGVMPPEHGRCLAGLLPQGRLAEVDDSYTLIPLDQPARLAQIVRDFTHAAGTT